MDAGTVISSNVKPNGKIVEMAVILSGLLTLSGTIVVELCGYSRSFFLVASDDLEVCQQIQCDSHEKLKAKQRHDCNVNIGELCREGLELGRLSHGCVNGKVFWKLG